MIELGIPEATPTLNALTRAHWTKYRQLRRHWSMLVLVAKSEAGAHGNAREPMAVTVVRYGKQPLDPDNLTGGCKVLIDALKDHGLIVDDNPVNLTLHVEQKKDRYPRTHVSIRSIAPPR
jgi:hypothetical protein